MINSDRLTVPSWLENTNSFESVRLAVCDLNGIFRGKRFPAGEINKLLEHGSRMPLSTCCIDIWGDDLIDSPFLFKSGDADGIVRSTGATLIPINWLDRPTALLPSWMSDDRGNPSPIDPRQILCSVLERYGTMGLTPMIAFELEFYLLDSNFDKLTLPSNPITSNRLQSTSVLSIDELDSFETFFSDV